MTYAVQYKAYTVYMYTVYTNNGDMTYTIQYILNANDPKKPMKDKGLEAVQIPYRHNTYRVYIYIHIQGVYPIYINTLDDLLPGRPGGMPGPPVRKQRWLNDV